MLTEQLLTSMMSLLNMLCNMYHKGTETISCTCLNDFLCNSMQSQYTQHSIDQATTCTPGVI